MMSKRVGRPTVKIDEGQLEKLAAIDCSFEEMASIVGCSVRTLHRNFDTVIEKGRAHGRASLKRKQFELAMSGNATMLIWLGKVRLGQKERQVVEHSGSVEVDVDELRQRFADRIAGVASRLGTRADHNGHDPGSGPELRS